jgi:2-amino-4-hydroxy-6-hydroxymethyldihydropteridine diphosphokinase
LTCIQPENVAIALGSNLGDSRRILQSALTTLDTRPGIRVLQRSRFYHTAPVGPPQPDYLNACAILETHLSPHALLQGLLQVERQFGRERRQRWGPRRLDLDLLLYGDCIIDTPDLIVPHPRMTERAFVLVPLAELAPHWVHPVTKRAIADLVNQVDCSGVQCNVHSP